MNIFFSGLKWGGKPGLVLDAMAMEECILLTSEEQLAELEDVLSIKFSWPQTEVAFAIRRIRALAEVVNPQFILTDCVDDDDNRILEAAVAGAADCIVTGDGHLLRMNIFRGIQILTASDFLLRMGPGSPHRQ